MGTIAGPKVITKGLKIYWDPANTDSYPGSGSYIYNLVGSRNLSGSISSTQGTLAPAGISGSTPVFTCVTSNAASGNYLHGVKILRLDIGHTTELSNIIGVTTGGWTIEEWLNIKGITYPNTPAGYVFSSPAYTDGATGFDLNHGQIATGSTKVGLSSERVGSSYEIVDTINHSDPSLTQFEKWFCRATIWDRDEDLFSVYINGQLQATKDISGVGSNTSLYDGGGGTLGHLYGHYHYGDRGQFRIYDRVLNSDELTQNYKANKSRHK